MAERTSEGHARSMRVIVAAMLANLAIAAAKFTAAAFTGSSAMLSEGIHSVADTGNEILLMVGDRLSRRPADDAHPFGHGRELYFWSLVVAMLLFGFGGGMSVYEGITHLARSAEPDHSVWNYAVLGVAFVAESMSLFVAMREFNRRRGDMPLWQAFRESKDPRVFIPLAEDTAALIGIVIALVGVSLAHGLDVPAFDGVSSIAIGLLLGIVALVLARETRSLLVGETADARIVQCIRRAAAHDPAVVSVNDIRSLHSSPDHIVVIMTIAVRDSLSAGEVARSVRQLKERIMAADARLTAIWIEVASSDDSRPVHAKTA